jgi:hypothetical protein
MINTSTASSSTRMAKVQLKIFPVRVMHKAPDHDRTQRLRRTAETAGQSGPHEIYDWQTSRRFNRKVD